MYFPYLRAQRFELLAIHECSSVIADSGRIIPILEPVNRNTDDLLRNLNRYREAAIRTILIENPGVGELRGEPEFVEQNIIRRIADDYDQLGVAHLITPESSAAELRQSVYRNRGRAFNFIHRHNFQDVVRLRELAESLDSFRWHIFINGSTGETYRTEFEASDRVLVDDGFERRPRNADYPEQSFFSDLDRRYRSMGYDGFGDFLIVGDHYFRRGGPAHAVALHMVTEGTGGLITRHFVSDRTVGTRDTEGKYLEAVNKLISAGQLDELLASTNSYSEFEHHHRSAHFPGLGYVKKLSMMHHLELMARSVN